MINSDRLGRELVDRAPEAGPDRGEHFIGFAGCRRRAPLRARPSTPTRIDAQAIVEICQLGVFNSIATMRIAIAHGSTRATFRIDGRNSLGRPNSRHCVIAKIIPRQASRDDRAGAMDRLHRTLRAGGRRADRRAAQ